MIGWNVTRSMTGNVTGHWALALFSLVAAFGVWFAIQDIENPRVEGLVPLGDTEQGVRVEALNVPDGFIVVDPQPVHVRVQARQADLPQLRAGDFKATVDVEHIQPGAPASVVVDVVARRPGVTVLGVEPATVPVTLVQAVTKEFRVQINLSGRLPEGYVQTDEPSVDPAFVQVKGRAELVDTVASVEVDVSLNGARDSTTVVSGDLIARTASGNPVAVTLSQPGAKVTLKLDQTFSQRTLALVPSITGSPAPGFIVTNIAVDPPVVVVTGVKAVIDSLQQMALEQVDVTAATKNIIQTRQVQRPPNVAADRQTVLVRVEIRAIDCTGGQTPASAPCGSATFFVAPTFGTPPAGLTLDPAPYFVQVHVSGPIAQLAALKPADFKAVVALSGGAAGTLAYPATVTAPAGVKVDSVDPLSVTLKGSQ